MAVQVGIPGVTDRTPGVFIKTAYQRGGNYFNEKRENEIRRLPGIYVLAAGGNLYADLHRLPDD